MVIATMSIKKALAMWQAAGNRVMARNTPVCLLAEGGRPFVIMGGDDALIKVRLEGEAADGELFGVAYGDFGRFVRQLPGNAGPITVGRDRGLVCLQAAIAAARVTTFVKETQVDDYRLPNGGFLVAADPDGAAIREVLGIYPVCATDEVRFALEHVAFSADSLAGGLGGMAGDGFVLAVAAARCLQEDHPPVENIFIHRLYAPAIVSLAAQWGETRIYYNPDFHGRAWIWFEAGESIVAVAPPALQFPDIAHIATPFPVVEVPQPVAASTLLAAAAAIRTTTKKDGLFSGSELVGVIWDDSGLTLSTTESQVVVGGVGVSYTPGELVVSLALLQTGLRLCGRADIRLGMGQISLRRGVYNSLRLDAETKMGNLQVVIAPRMDNLPSPADGIFKQEKLAA